MIEHRDYIAEAIADARSAGVPEQEIAEIVIGSMVPALNNRLIMKYVMLKHYDDVERL